MTSCLCSVVTMALFCTVFEVFDLEKYCDLEIWVRGHSLFILCALQAYESTPSHYYCSKVVRSRQCKLTVACRRLQRWHVLLMLVIWVSFSQCC